MCCSHLFSTLKIFCLVRVNWRLRIICVILRTLMYWGTFGYVMVFGIHNSDKRGNFILKYLLGNSGFYFRYPLSKIWGSTVLNKDVCSCSYQYYNTSSSSTDLICFQSIVITIILVICACNYCTCYFMGNIRLKSTLTQMDNSSTD